MGLFDKLKTLFKSGPKQKGKVKLPVIDVAKRFELMGRTGQGSMSKVWRARDKQLGRLVCLKILDREKTAKFEARFPGLSRPPEGQVLTQLKHDNIVKTFEYGITRDREPYIIMELIEGHGLNFLIETKSPKLEGKRTDLLAQLAAGMEFIHKGGFMHRDICPRNVMVSSEGVVKIIDFGLAIPYTPPFCRPGNRTGTINYMAPELIKRQSTDHRVDVFALGVTAYESYTGQLPWEKAESSETLVRHMNSPPRDPKEFRPDLDDKTRAFLLKAVERDREKRFQTATEFRDAILRLPEA